MSTAVLGDTLSFVIIIIAFSRHHHHHHVIAMCVCTCCDDGGSVASPGLAQGRLALLSFFLHRCYWCRHGKQHNNRGVIGFVVAACCAVFICS